MARVLVAGATGYLGRHVALELKHRGQWVRSVVRRSEQDVAASRVSDDVVLAQVTDSRTLRGIADRIDVVFSSIGITRQKDGFTYEEVDYRANINLLEEALRSGVKRFVYVSILHGPDLRHVALIDAKERFVDALYGSGLDSIVVRPTGFFPDMSAILDMAHRGVVVLLDDGDRHINPIAGHDAAVACVDAVLAPSPSACAEVGGPDVFTYNDIASLAFSVLKRREHIWHVPRPVVQLTMAAVGRIAPASVYGPLQFFSAVCRHDMVAPTVGRERLSGFFESAVPNYSAHHA
jgi:uncharacterized protein YbjT (DUF2867 family)